MPKRAKHLGNGNHKAVPLPETAQALLEARKAAGLTRPQVAELFKVNAHSLYRWEAGKRGIAAEEFQRLMAAYRAYQTKRPIATVPRGTVGDQRMAWERVVNTERAQDWLDEFRAQLRKLGVSQDERDAAVRSVRRVGLAPAVGGTFQDWTEDEAIQAMENAGKLIIDMFSDLRGAR